MELYEKKEECCGCGACADVCEAGAVHMVSDIEGFYYPCIEEELCVNCGKCRQVCPIKKQSTTEYDNKFFGVRAKDDTLRYSGSSGGIFSVLAEYVLGHNGVVYGAGYNGSMQVVHREASDRKELEKIKKTKYVQSSMGGVYRRIKEQAEKGRWILFCGTPCQAHALRLFLDADYEKLIIADLVCYGVPSPGIWMDYVKHLEKRHKGKMTDFSFRDKRNRDSGHTRSYVIDGKEYAGSLHQDTYCRLFFKNDSLRLSCHSCKFCTVERDSDFTIGDFWGIERVRPDLDDGMGISMVILHTEKAEKIWGQVKENTIWFECEKEDLLQPRLMSPTPVGEKRGRIMGLYKILPFSLFMKWVEIVELCRNA